MKPAPLAQVLALSLLIIALPVSAAESKQKNRTLQELITLALTTGADRSVGPNTSKNLGFESNALSKAFRYEGNIAPDKRSHEFHVVYETQEEGKTNPIALIWKITKTTEKDDFKLIDRWVLRISLDGKLQVATHVSGKENEAKPIRFDSDDSRANKIFKNEKKFYLKDSIPLEMSVE